MVIGITLFHVKRARFGAGLEVLLAGLNEAVFADNHKRSPK